MNGSSRIRLMLLLSYAATSPFGHLHAQAQAATCRVAIVVRDSAGAPIADVALEPPPSDSATRSGADGRAMLVTRTGNPYTVKLRRIGYLPGRTTVMPVCGAQPEPLEVKLAELATAIAPIVVSARAPRRFTGPMAGFYERRARGDGTFFSIVDIDRRNVQRLSDLLRTVPAWGRSQQADRLSEAITRGTAARMGAPTQSARSGSTRCFPTVVIDGMAATMAELNVEGIDPRSLSGVEVYVDGARTPSEFWGTAGQGRCGVVALWSRSYDNLTHTPLEQQSASVGTIYEPHEVDEVARIDERAPLQVAYPRELKRKKTAGEATVSVVVLPSGEPFMRDLRVVRASLPEFGTAVIDAMPTLRFKPASRAGTLVTQRAELTVRFEDQTTARP